MFVFTITQLTTVLVHHPDWDGVAQVAVMLFAIWWMYAGYAWLTNSIDLARPTFRLFLLGAMCAYLVLALAIPDAFTSTGLTFGLAYLAICPFLPPSLIATIRSNQQMFPQDRWSFGSLTAMSVVILGWVLLWRFLRRWTLWSNGSDQARFGRYQLALFASLWPVPPPRTRGASGRTTVTSA